MILGIGTDLVEIHRFKRLLNKYPSKILKRILSLDEQNDFLSKKFSSAFQLAKRFAAKEAFVKALGTGFSQGIFLTDIQISHTFEGKPFFKIKGNVEKILKNQYSDFQAFNFHLSLSDTQTHALAFVVIEGLNN